MYKHKTVSYNKSKWGDIAQVIDVLENAFEDFTYYIETIKCVDNKWYVRFIEETPDSVELDAMKIIVAIGFTSDGVYSSKADQYFYINRNLEFELVSEDEVHDIFG